jgi:hypothetical protein
MIFAAAAQAADSSDNTAAWLTFVGAILVAALAAFTAQIRLRAQLKHDRELRDVEHLRSVLDEAAGLLETAIARLFEYGAARHDEDQTEEDIEEARERAVEARWAMERHERRLDIRLPRDEPAAVAYSAAIDAIEGAINALGRTPTPTATDLENFADMRKLGAQQHARFTAAARNLVGVRLPRS